LKKGSELECGNDNIRNKMSDIRKNITRIQQDIIQKQNKDNESMQFDPDVTIVVVNLPNEYETSESLKETFSYMINDVIGVPCNIVACSRVGARDGRQGIVKI
jgi:predicted RNase H-like nuclease (RuvC/YqgF family)